MKIKRYPGKAVDASLSLEGTNAMGIIYEANWMNAHQNMSGTLDAVDLTRKSGTMLAAMPKISTGNGSYLDGGISTLSKYQITLDQIRAFEQQQRDEGIVKTIKDLNGYKPSTLRRKLRKQYPGWDELVETNEQTQQNVETQKILAPAIPQQTNHYVLDPTEKRQQRPRQQVPGAPPFLRRSQTMVYTPRSANATCSTLDIKDLRRMWRTEQQHAAVAAAEDNGKHKFISSPIVDIEMAQPVIATQPQLRQKVMPPPPPIRNCDTRITSSSAVPPSTGQTELRITATEPPKPAQRTVLPPMRTKSVRIVTNSRDMERPLPPKPPPRTNIPAKIGITDSLTPTVVPAPRKLKAASATLADNGHSYNISARCHSAENMLVDSLNDLTLSKNIQNGGTISDRQRRQPGSSSSTNSSDDQFIIPRPRLIVPVHTYARKRRTGNLKDQDLEQISTTPNDTVPQRRNKGKNFILQQLFF